MFEHTMCDNLELAKRNRERVKSDYGGRFYAQQEHAVAQWGLGDKKPESVVLGELPYVGKIGRNGLDTD